MPPTNNRELEVDPSFAVGMRSAGNPLSVPQGAYVSSFNTTSRGGIVKCRPGYRQRLRLPDGKLQGLTWFRPTGANTILVFAVNGKVYTSSTPFETYSEIPGIQFSEKAERIIFARAEQTNERNADRSIKLISARSLLIMQDGLSAPAFFDGSQAEHITGSETTPLGTAMAWSNSRLWVGREQQLFASDINNPLSFIEGQYIGEAGIGAFVLPGPITALAEVPSTSSPLLLAFTETNTTAFQAGVPRDAWETTPDFKNTVFPEIGCVAPFSVIAHYGYLWWLSNKGLVNLNQAVQTSTNSAIRLLDSDMAYSKKFVKKNNSQAAFGAFEGYLLASVPFAGETNRHTWCLDMTGLDNLSEDQIPGWSSYWVGTQPVQWTDCDVFGEKRIFHISRDRDGGNRLWEAFEGLYDNGCPITWGWTSRGYVFGTTTRKEFHHAKVWLNSLEGEVDAVVKWGALFRGRFHEACNKRIVATRGSISADLELDYMEDSIFALKKQSRVLTTTEQRNSDQQPYDSCGVEDSRQDQVDIAFQLCVLANGPGAISMVELHAVPQNQEISGKCEDNESGFRGSSFEGADGSEDSYEKLIQSLQISIPSTFSASATATASYAGVSVVSVGHADSVISQACADKQAKCIAEMRAAQRLYELAPPYLGGFRTDNCVATDTTL